MGKGKLTATFDGDSKRYHRFVIDEGQRIVGMVYVPKNQEIPDEITVRLRTSNERDAERSRD